MELPGFRDFLLNHKCMANITISTYMKDIESNPQLAGLLPVHPDMLDAVLKEPMGQKQISICSANRLLTALRHYNEYLNYMKQQYPKESNLLTTDQIKRILAQPDTVKFTGLRNKVVLTLLCSTGITVSELISLNIGDVDTEHCTLQVNGGSKKYTGRKLPLAMEDMPVLCTYLIKTGRTDENAPLFAGTGAEKRLSRSWIWKIVGTYAKKAGYSHVTPSDLRMYYVKAQRAQGLSAASVQRALGMGDYADLQDYYLEYYVRAKTS